MAIIKLSATERRRASAFFTCLVLAIFAWMFTVLSNTYSYTVKAALNFRNTPQKRAFHSLQSDTINATINGTGWQMVFSKMHNEVNFISIDLRSLEYKSYVVLSSQLSQINPDTLYFDFSNRKVKRVPIQLITLVKYKHQFSQSGNISLNPAYVVVNGPANVIDNIQSWKSDTLKLDSISESVNTRLTLQPVREGNVSVFPKTVEVRIPVDEYTEKTLEIPVKLINNRNYYDVKIFPQKVKVTFTTSLSRYAQMDEDFFEANVDLDLWRKHGYKALPVVIFKSPAYTRIVKIEPQNIDFIIKK
jgi:YbbR domain-containing protein